MKTTHTKVITVKPLQFRFLQTLNHKKRKKTAAKFA